MKRQDFLKFLASLNLNKYRNLKSEDKQDELPLDFTFAKSDNDWKIDRIAKVN